jgi:hypothetical protein
MPAHFIKPFLTVELLSFAPIMRSPGQVIQAQDIPVSCFESHA